MGVLKTNIHGNSNIGLYMFCNDKFCLVGKSVEDIKIAEIERALKVPVHKITIAGTDLIGAFIAGNNNKIIIIIGFNLSLSFFPRPEGWVLTCA